MFSAVLPLFLMVSAGAVRVSPQPQKFTVLYSLTDPRVPSALGREGGPFPVGGVTAIANPRAGVVWVGTRNGLFRYDSHAAARDRVQYFAGRRYLADDDVRALLADSGQGVWVRTQTGVSHIELRTMTLDQKAAYFEQRIRARHDRYGMVADSRLMRPGDLGSNRLESSDNDGLWTAMYAAGECFRYAVTHSPEALARARRATEAVLFLASVTGRPGFPARSYVRKGEPVPADGVWHDSADGRFVWKGDTSSDELVGHFLLYSIVFDLLPDPAVKERVREAARAIMDHILAHGYYLTDINGQPTTWGKWSLAYFSTPEGKPDSPLNAVELLSFLRTTQHLTGDARYEREYRKVALDMGYARIAAQYKELDDELNYSDEELAMLSFYPLFRYERDPELLRLYRDALGQWWENMQREKNPLWTFIYAMANPTTRPDLESAAWTLNRMPMDMVDWTVENSKRADLKMEGSVDRFGGAETSTLLPPDERPVMKWNSNPFRVDGGNQGASEDDGATFLLPYWMGRFHGFLTEAP